jgi:hypothetical protein
MTDAVARPRDGVEPELRSRWTPRYVWTLHRVPGRLDGPPLAVRRRVIVEEECLSVETPGGDTSVSADELSAPERGGRARSYGSHRYDERREPPPSGFYGQDLAIDIYDHPPTDEERAQWMAVRRRFSAMLAKLPRYAYLAYPAKDGLYQVPKVEIRRAETLGGGGRFVLEYRYRGHEWASVICGPDLYDLAEQGWSSVGSRSDGVRLYLAPPPPEDLAALAAKRAEQVARDRRAQREAEDFANAFRDFSQRVRAAAAEPPGLAALRAFGLDAKATADDVRRIFRQKAKITHPDKGGSGDMGRLVELRDLALAYVQQSAGVGR